MTRDAGTRSAGLGLARLLVQVSVRDRGAREQGASAGLVPTRLSPRGREPACCWCSVAGDAVSCARRHRHSRQPRSAGPPSLTCLCSGSPGRAAPRPRPCDRRPGRGRVDPGPVGHGQHQLLQDGQGREVRPQAGGAASLHAALGGGLGHRGRLRWVPVGCGFSVATLRQDPASPADSAVRRAGLRVWRV